MRTAKTHIRRRGEKGLVILYDDTVPLRKQAEEFKRTRAKTTDDKVSEVHYQESDGPLRVLCFRSPEELKALQDAQKKSDAEAKASASHAAREAEKVREAKLKKIAAVEKANLEADKKARAEAAVKAAESAKQ